MLPECLGAARGDAVRAFGVSRKTGHQRVKRYREEGPGALCDRGAYGEPSSIANVALTPED